MTPELWLLFQYYVVWMSTNPLPEGLPSGVLAVGVVLVIGGGGGEEEEVVVKGGS